VENLSQGYNMSNKDSIILNDIKYQLNNDDQWYAEYNYQFIFDDSIISCINNSSYTGRYVCVLETWTFTINGETLPEFEKLFPEFPYHRDVYNIKQVQNEIKNVNDRLDKLVSHMETIMIMLGQRSASDDNLQI
jgi:hypothetical protein